MKKITLFQNLKSIFFATLSLAVASITTSQNLIAKGFSFPESLTKKWIGVDTKNGEPCTVHLSTDQSGWVSRLLIDGFFEGQSLVAPSGLGPIPGGFEGSVNLFKKASYGEFSYFHHVLKDGVTISWNEPHGNFHSIEAKFYGPNVYQISKVVYEEKSVFLNLRGTCTRLQPANAAL